jgi:hypothetical protein
VNAHRVARDDPEDVGVPGELLGQAVEGLEQADRDQGPEDSRDLAPIPEMIQEDKQNDRKREQPEYLLDGGMGGSS